MKSIEAVEYEGCISFTIYYELGYVECNGQLVKFNTPTVVQSDIMWLLKRTRYCNSILQRYGLKLNILDKEKCKIIIIK